MDAFFVLVFSCACVCDSKHMPNGLRIDSQPKNWTMAIMFASWFYFNFDRIYFFCFVGKTTSNMNLCMCSSAKCFVCLHGISIVRCPIFDAAAEPPLCNKHKECENESKCNARYAQHTTSISSSPRKHEIVTWEICLNENNVSNYFRKQNALRKWDPTNRIKAIQYESERVYVCIGMCI